MAEAGAGNGPGVAIRECPPRGRIVLRGDPNDPGFIETVADTIGLEPPLTPNTVRSAGDGTVLWLGPDEWSVEVARALEADIADRLERSLAGRHVSVAAVGDAAIVLSVSGPRAADVLAKGMTLDFDRLQAGDCARSLLGKVPVLVHRPGEGLAYEVTVARSYADHALRWLEDAALEYGFGA